jgi:hypothetical protein
MCIDARIRLLPRKKVSQRNLLYLKAIYTYQLSTFWEARTSKLLPFISPTGKNKSHQM